MATRRSTCRVLKVRVTRLHSMPSRGPSAGSTTTLQAAPPVAAAPALHPKLLLSAAPSSHHQSTEGR